MKMWFWREDYFRTLTDVACEAAKLSKWEDYAAFCSEYERGLRAQAFTTLARFMLALERAPFAERREFVSWLMHATDGTSGVHMAVPHPLRRQLSNLLLSSGQQLSLNLRSRTDGSATMTI